MKRFTAIVLALMLLVSASAFAQYQERDERLVERGIEYGEFDSLYSVNTVTLNTTASVNFVGSTATGSTAISVPTSVPYKLRLQNHNVGSITYTLFAADATGVTQPTATSSHLLSPQGEAVVSGKAWEKIFYSTPNISIGASGATEVQLEIWTRSRR